MCVQYPEMAQFLRRVRAFPNPLRRGLHPELRGCGPQGTVSQPETGESILPGIEASLSPAGDGEFRSCPTCGTEVQRGAISSTAPSELSGSFRIRPGVIWATSLGVWAFIALAGTLTIYQTYRMMNGTTSLGKVAAMELCQVLSYAPLTPFAFKLAIRYPIQRRNWIKPTLVHLTAGLVFAFGHVAIRGCTPFGVYDSSDRDWTYIFWNSHAHSFRLPWQILKRAYMANVVDDVTSGYVPIILIALALLYHHNSQQKELRATQLSGQLAKARLQVLKNQIQPHFLFNTLHSISALMLTNVVAADRMMTSLSDLLRMSLQDKGSQLTTLNRDLEFLSVYVEIEKARFEDRLCVTFDIEPQCLDAQVPHLFLQPLVENAVRHGTSKRSRPGEINVIAKRREGTLELSIQDNGAGFQGPTEDLFKRGLGLSVTRERLEALYGNQQECKIRNLETGGAEVYVRLPFRLALKPGQMDSVGHGYM